LLQGGGVIATVVYDLGRAEDIAQIVLLSDWWAKRPDGGQLGE
jgi:hypothetical protein